MYIGPSILTVPSGLASHNVTAPQPDTCFFNEAPPSVTCPFIRNGEPNINASVISLTQTGWSRIVVRVDSWPLVIGIGESAVLAKEKYCIEIFVTCTI